MEIYTDQDSKDKIIKETLPIFKSFIGVHRDDDSEDDFYKYCLSVAYEYLYNIDGIKIYSDDLSKQFLIAEAQRVLTQSKEETLYERGLKLSRHYATRRDKNGR